MNPVVSVVGHHNSGKTRLVAAIVGELTERGYRVGTLKHAPHLDRLDSEGSDSRAHRDAGAVRVLLRGNTESALFWEHGTDPGDDLSWALGNCDLVIAEGFKHGPWPKIEVFRRSPDLPLEPLAGELDVLAVVTDDGIALPDSVRRFSPAKLAEIVDFIESILLGTSR